MIDTVWSVFYAAKVITVTKQLTVITCTAHKPAVGDQHYKR